MSLTVAGKRQLLDGVVMRLLLAILIGGVLALITGIPTGECARGSARDYAGRW